MTIPISELTYTVSIAFRKSGTIFSSQDLARGFLNDRLILSFGRWDKTCHFMEIEVEDILQDHYICDDLIYKYINEI